MTVALVLARTRREPPKLDNFLRMWAHWMFLRWFFERERAAGREGIAEPLAPLRGACIDPSCNVTMAHPAHLR